MAAPLTEPDPLAWRVALRLAKHDQRRLKVVPYGSVLVLNNPPPVDDLYVELRGATPAEAALWPAEAADLALELVRTATGTHLVQLHSEYALCRTRIVGPFTAGQELSCPACTSTLPPEA